MFCSPPLERCGASVNSLVCYCALIDLRKCPTIPVLATLGITLNSTALPSGSRLSDPPFKFSGNFENPFLFAQPGVECSQRISSVRRLPVWSNGKMLDLISVWGEEAVQSQLRANRRNYDTFGQISRDMMESGHDWDALQCRIKVKELQNAYRKVRQANRRSGAAPATCRAYKELDVILGGDPTSTLSTTMDTSEPSSTRQEEEHQSGSEGAEVEEDIPRSKVSARTWAMCLHRFLGRATVVPVPVRLTCPRHYAVRGRGTIAAHRQAAYGPGRKPHCSRRPSLASQVNLSNKIPSRMNSCGKCEDSVQYRGPVPLLALPKAQKPRGLYSREPISHA
ncbi:Zinc finger and SCAN domain-containing protein 29 [Chelonia mydas]|uniref:Zinc finger and SCAN domain-containing protein 29 n=1 Tax=Chelonia mydas TaxID=8469 RepID=M7BNE0_CHEMY|nr:Zinc finger and SCAN domain-containing protein 29 [Chelonia mydas]